MIDPGKTCLFIPNGLKEFKLNLFERIGRHIESFGGKVNRHDVQGIADLPNEIIPIVGCHPDLTDLVNEWRRTKRNWIYWDRGYARRVFATWLPRGESGGYYRWHLNGYQMQELLEVSDDRWKALKTEVQPWKSQGRHIVVAAPTRTYSKYHRTESWIADTIDAIARVSERQIVIRDKESKRPLQADLENAHCLVTHGSIAAVESVILGCPVFVHSDSAAALVGQTKLIEIERPVYPDRTKWLNSLAYCQYNEQELIDGTLWKLLH